MPRRDPGTLLFPAVCVITAGAAVAAQRDTSPAGVWVFVTVLGGWLITLSLHEYAHAVLALAGGDSSVRARGYLTLNPLRYTDPANSVIIPIVLLAIGGIPLPGGAVVIQPGRLRARWWSSVVSAGGPLTNIVLGLALARLGIQFDSDLGAALEFLAALQFFAAMLNLLPVPGFDGFGILAPYLPGQLVARWNRWRPWLPLVVFAVLWFIPHTSSTVFGWVASILNGVGGSWYLAAIGSSLFQFWR